MLLVAMMLASCACYEARACVGGTHRLGAGVLKVRRCRAVVCVMRIPDNTADFETFGTSPRARKLTWPDLGHVTFFP